jgi:hypothetical protein
MTLVRMEGHAREDLWPTDSTSVCDAAARRRDGRLSGSSTSEGSSWRYTLEFRGAREG